MNHLRVIKSEEIH